MGTTSVFITLFFIQVISFFYPFIRDLQGQNVITLLTTYYCSIVTKKMKLTVLLQLVTRVRNQSVL